MASTYRLIPRAPPHDIGELTHPAAIVTSAVGRVAADEVGGHRLDPALVSEPIIVGANSPDPTQTLDAIPGSEAQDDVAAGGHPHEGPVEGGRRRRRPHVTRDLHGRNVPRISRWRELASLRAGAADWVEEPPIEDARHGL